MNAPIYYKKSSNTKLFLLIVTAIVVGLAVFFIGKSQWDNHEATVTQEQVKAQQQEQEATVQQAREQSKDYQSNLYSAQLKQLHDSIGCINQYKDSQNTGQLQSCIGQYNATASTVPTDLLRSMNYPTGFDNEGNPQN